MSSEDQKQRSEATRQAILDTALDIGLQEGFEALSIRKITQRMRYSTGVVYHHFQDKQEIIDAIEASETARLRAMILELIDDDQDILRNMARVFHRMMRLALEEPETYNLIVLHKYSRARPARPEWLAAIGAGLAKGVRDGLIRDLDPERAAFSLWTWFVGYNLILAGQPGRPAEAAEALFQTQLHILVRGIVRNEECAHPVRDQDPPF